MYIYKYYIHLCANIYIHVYIYTCVHIYNHTYTHVFTHMYLHSHAKTFHNKEFINVPYPCSHMNESYHTYQSVMPHVSMSHTEHINEYFHACKWTMPHVWLSHDTFRDALNNEFISNTCPHPQYFYTWM